MTERRNVTLEAPRELASESGSSAGSPVNPDVAWALREIPKRARSAGFFAGYYAGEHRLMIDRARLRTIFGKLFADFRLNLCGAVVDALTDRLRVVSFSAQDAVSATGAQEAGQIWERNRMRRQQSETHRAAIASGDAYIVVWPDPTGYPRIYPQNSREVVVEYDAADPAKVTRAAKMWPEQILASGASRYRWRWRLNIFRPDRIEKWAATSTASADGSTAGPSPGARAFAPYVDEDGVWPLLNPYGRVPVFHFANNSSVLGALGVSELRDAVPVQDWVNYSVFSMLVGQEFQGFPQRYAIGVEVPIDEQTGQPYNPFRAGPDRMWFADPATTEDAEGDEKLARVTMGQFPAADLDQLLNVKREASLSMAQATATPPHHFMLPSGVVSGESQKTAEQRLDTKVSDRQATFGDTWADAMRFAVTIEHQSTTPETVGGFDANWLDLKPRNELESWTVAEKKEKLGVSRAQIQREQGYTNRQIARFARDEGADVTLAEEDEE